MLIRGPNRAVSTQVIDTQGHALFKKDDATDGKFAFTTEDYEMFDVCFLTATTGGHRQSKDSLEMRLTYLLPCSAWWGPGIQGGALDLEAWRGSQGL